MTLKIVNIKDLVNVVTDRNPDWLESFALIDIESVLRETKAFFGIRYEDIHGDKLNDIESVALETLHDLYPF